MKENNKAQANKLSNSDIQKENGKSLEKKLQTLSEEVLKIQNSFSNLLAQDKKLKEQLSNITMQTDDRLDDEIWIANKIEEAKQETESIIYEKIKALNYEKTILDVNKTIEKLRKNIEQVDYDKKRALESLEDDFNIKIEDVKVIEDNILEDKIIGVTEEKLKKISNDIVNLEKKTNKDFNKLFKEIQLNQESKLLEVKKDIDDKIKNIQITNIEALENESKSKNKNNKKQTENSKSNAVSNEHNNENQTNYFKEILAENRKEFSKEISNFEKQISGFQDTLIVLQTNISKAKNITSSDIEKLEKKVTDTINTANTQTKEETNKAVENLIERIEATKKISEEQQERLKQILDKKIQESENKNKELINKKISELNVDKIKENISTLEKMTISRVNGLASNFDEKLEKLEIEKLKTELSSLEKMANTKIHQIESNLNSKIEDLGLDKLKEAFSKLESDSSKKIEQIVIEKIEEEKIRNEKIILKTIDELNIDEVKDSIDELEKISEEKINELERNFDSKIEDIKQENSYKRQMIETYNTVKQTNEIKDLMLESKQEFSEEASRLENKVSDFQDLLNNLQTNISKIQKSTAESMTLLETNLTDKLLDNNEKNYKEQENSKKILDEKIEALTSNINNTIEQLQSYNLKQREELEKSVTTNINEVKSSITDLEKNSEEKIKEITNINQALTKKVNELNTINEKKLDKVRKEQEKFIIQKISEMSSTTEETEQVKAELKQAMEKLKKVEIAFEEIQDKNFKEIQDYVEKRILRMKFATTIQLVTKEISDLKEKIKTLQEIEDKNSNYEENIESIIEERVNEALVQMLQEQEEIVEEKVNKALKQIAKRQDTVIEKRVNKLAMQMKEEQELLVEQQVKQILRQMAKEQKAKKEQKAALVSKVNRKKANIEYETKSIERQKNTNMPTRAKRDIFDLPDYNIEKSINKKRKSANSLDDMVATLSKSPISRNGITRKSISTMAKAAKKSQLLNYDYYN